MLIECSYCHGDHPTDLCSDRWQQVEKYIWHDKLEKAYFFQDESETLEGNGPYESAEKAKEALTEYCKHL